MTKEELIKRIMELDRYHYYYGSIIKRKDGYYIHMTELLELIKESKE